MNSSTELHDESNTSFSTFLEKYWLDKAKDGQLLNGDINHARTTNRCAINITAKSWTEKGRDKVGFQPRSSKY